MLVSRRLVALKRKLFLSLIANSISLLAVRSIALNSPITQAQSANTTLLGSQCSVAQKPVNCAKRLSTQLGSENAT